MAEEKRKPATPVFDLMLKPKDAPPGTRATRFATVWYDFDRGRANVSFDHGFSLTKDGKPVDLNQFWTNAFLKNYKVDLTEKSKDTPEVDTDFF
jgi:hypothetical protein